METYNKLDEVTFEKIATVETKETFILSDLLIDLERVEGEKTRVNLNLDAEISRLQALISEARKIGCDVV